MLKKTTYPSFKNFSFSYIIIGAGNIKTTLSRVHANICIYCNIIYIATFTKYTTMRTYDVTSEKQMFNGLCDNSALKRNNSEKRIITIIIIIGVNNNNNNSDYYSLLANYYYWCQ